MNREQIISAYRRLMQKSPTRPPGMNALLDALPGLSQHAFRGRIWRTWRSFQEEVGVAPNTLNVRMPDEAIVQGLALLTRKIGRVPFDADIVFERKRDGTVPSEAAVRRRARTREERVAILREFCSSHAEFADILAFLSDVSEPDAIEGGAPLPATIGYIYLQKSGRRFKIGRTNSPSRRLGEVQLQVPDEVSLLHVIPTDDPGGVEAYWKKRFETRNIRGEWYKLTPSDVASFKRWKSQ